MNSNPSKRSVPTVPQYRGTVAGILVLLSLFSSAQNCEAEEFRWRVAEGDNFSVVLSQKMTATSTCDTKERVEGTEAKINLAWQVTVTTEESFTVEQTIQAISLQLKTDTSDGSGLVVLDTDSDKKLQGVAEKLRKELLALKGAKFTAQYDYRGKLLSVAIDEKTEETFRNAPANTPLTEMLTTEGLTRLFGRTQMILPEGDVSPGFKWKIEPFEPGPVSETNANDAEVSDSAFNWFFVGKTTRNNRELFRFKSANHNRSVIREDPTELRKMTVDGDYLFDNQLGLPVSGTVTTSIEMVSQYRELSVRTVVDTETTYEMTKN